ncbi:MAG: insulinase family protein [Armatimonadetes bacterium]|nr:insulinase family protein [Armatimonadota bacterium]MDE2207752.1 insulinase family protein [Armatimonadota bacterium]
MHRSLRLKLFSFLGLATWMSVALCCACAGGQGAAPEVVSTALSNGMRIDCVERQNEPIVAIDLWIRAGSREETRSDAGSAHFVEHVVFDGTGDRPGSQCDSQVEAVGCSLTGATLPDGVHFFGVAPAGSVPTVLQVLSDIVQHATASQEAVDRERQVILNELALRDIDPVQRLTARLFRDAFGHQPYSRSPGGEPADIRLRGRDTIAAFYHQFYQPGRAVLVLVGDIQPAVAAAAAAPFASWKSTAAPAGPGVSIPLPAPAGSPAFDSGEQLVGVAWPAPAQARLRTAAAARASAVWLEHRIRSTPGVTARHVIAVVIPREQSSLLICTAMTANSTSAAAFVAAAEHAAADLAATPPEPKQVLACSAAVLGNDLFTDETDVGLAHTIGLAEVTGGALPQEETGLETHVDGPAMQQFARAYLLRKPWVATAERSTR